MSKNRSGSISREQADKLFNMTAGKLGSDSETLRREFQSGNYQRAMSSLSKSDAQKLQKALSNPELTAKVLSSPQARAIMEKLSKGGK